MHPDIAVEKESNELETNANKAQETWKKALETFKEEALKMKATSDEAYDMYIKQAEIVLKDTSETLKIQAEIFSKQAMIAFEESSETLKIQAEIFSKQAMIAFKESSETLKIQAEIFSKQAMIALEESSETLTTRAKNARENITVAAKQISEGGKVYLSEAAKDSPDSIKDVETFTMAGDLEELAAIRDFYLGILYGAFLSGGGFLSFMLTGSISAVRFGVILGSSLLALSVASLRSWKSGQSSELYIKGQAAIAAIATINEWQTFAQSKHLSTSLMVLISGGMLAFYTYRILIDGSAKEPSSENSSDIRK